MTKIRTLFLGINIEKPDIEKVFDPFQASSLFDYDIVIADIDFVLRDLQDKLPFDGMIERHDEEREILRNINQKLLEETQLLLSKGGLLVCLLKPPRGFEYSTQGQYGANYHYVSNYGWLPLGDLAKYPHWQVSYGKGNRIIVTDKPNSFSPYLKMKEIYWTAYLSNIKNLTIETFALHDAGLPVAFEIAVGKGSIVFLPLSTHPKMGEILLQCATNFLHSKRHKVRLSPEWLRNHVVPAEIERTKEFDELSQQISSLQGRLAETDKKIKEITAIKKLLYEGDEALEDIVRIAFEEIGFSLSKKDDMDWISTTSAGSILEVTGCENTIDIDKLRQLLNYLLNDYIETGKEKKAILVGNHFINKPLEERGDPFTEKVLQEASVHSICLLTTAELFSAICAIREGKIAAKEVQERIMKTVGLCKLV